MHGAAHDEAEPEDVRAAASKTWAAMKRTAKAGQRRTLPDMQEIDAMFKGQRSTTVVYFLDGTFEELAYDGATSVAEAVETLAAQIKLENYQTFSLFTVQKVGGTGGMGRAWMRARGGVWAGGAKARGLRARTTHPRPADERAPPPPLPPHPTRPPPPPCRPRPPWSLACLCRTR